ncbi:hypothetical protein ABW21_db0202330 [Orbilia brochopaga]|nr:hypothetical protein ABW21_db0202330 [Drechslerella brochopaga]
MRLGNHYIPPEITEDILLQVPAICLITTCRSVCRAWKTLIETSPQLVHYSRTGLPLPRPGHTTKCIPQITPLAIYILGCFWAKLARQCMLCELEPLSSSLNIHPMDNRRQRYRNTELIKLAGESRRKLPACVRELVRQFADIVEKVPFITPENPHGLDFAMDVHPYANWESMSNSVTPSIRVPELYCNLPMSDFKIVMAAITLVVHEWIPLVWRARTPPTLQLLFKDPHVANDAAENTILFEAAAFAS